MKTRTKRMLLLSLCVALLAVCGVFAFAATDTEYKVVDHVVYQLIPADGKEIAHYDIVSFFDSEKAAHTTTRIIIPSEIDGIPVATIDARNIPSPDLYFDSVVKKIVLPDTITEIGKHAFVNLRNLSNIEIPASVTSLGYAAFSYCNSLKEITIPEKVQVIGFSCFGHCENLQNVNILGNGLKTIAKAAFSNCTNLTTIHFPSSLTFIGRQAFFRTGLKTVRIPGRCVLQDNAFTSATGLKKVVFESRTDDNADFIGAAAFHGCKSLKKVYLPKEAAEYRIAATTFEDCKKLKAVYRTTYLIEIGYHAFNNCESLTAFTVPAGITRIDKTAFDGCTGLKKLRVLATDSAFLKPQKTNAKFLNTLPDTCKVYVKTAAMKRAVAAAGCPGKVIVKADLK